MRYAKYALGEIVLVVVGILIALQINDWYQERLDRKTESEYLLSMQRDLAEDTRELREAIKGNLHLLAGLDDTLHLLAEPQDDEAWRRDLYIHGIKYTYWFVLMEFSRLTMAQLQYSGGMRLISDTRVREAMIELNILTLMYQRQLQLADSLSALIEEQYGARVTS
jgi:hypothetical protein